MDIYQMRVSDLDDNLKKRIQVVPDQNALNKKIAGEFTDILEEKTKKNEPATFILPVGPLDYRFFVREIKKRNLTCRNLRTINMDEYLDDNDRFIPTSHPLSFHRFMDETFFSLLEDEEKPLPENIIFPEPDCPEKITRLIDSSGGADV